MKMNLPNKLTILRVLLIPFFVFFLLVPVVDYGNYIAVAIFIVASLTDLADGKIARKYNLVTNFGKFMDPLADKLLVCSAMICLVATGQLAAWMVIIIISREFIISGFRLVAADNGVVSQTLKPLVALEQFLVGKFLALIVFFDFHFQLGKFAQIVEDVRVDACPADGLCRLEPALARHKFILAVQRD